MRTRWLAMSVSLLVAALPGCSWSETGAACLLVDDSVIEELAVSQLSDTATAAFGGRSACRYELQSGAIVIVDSLPSIDWAADLSERLVAESGADLFSDPENQRKFAEARQLLDEGLIEQAGSACEVFSLLAEIEDIPPGTTQVVNFVPSRANPLHLSAQRCEDGVHSVVDLEGTDLLNPETTQRIRTALDAVHAAGVAATG